MSAYTTTKATRDVAKAALTARLATVREDLARRSVGGRIADKVIGDATDAALEAVDIVESHKAVVGGTLAAIVVWFLRNPIITAIRHLSARMSKRGRGVWS